MARRNRLVHLSVAALALANGGCLATAVGAAAAGAGAAGYAYVKGRFYRDYPASLDDAFAGIRTALTELQFPIDHEEKANGKASIESRTSDQTEIRVEFETLQSRVPAEGQVTRVYIRVGTFGDELVCARIFDQADLHFVPPGTVPPRPATMATPPAPPAPLTPVTVAPANRAFETAPPPLAGAQPAANWTAPAAQAVKPVAAAPTASK